MAKHEKKRNPLLRLVTFILTAVLLLGALALVVFRDRWNVDALVRTLRYYNIERNDSGEAVPFDHGGKDTDIYTLLDGNMLLCSPNYLQLYAQSGTSYIDKSIAFQRPVIRTAGRNAIVFDVGGKDYFLISGRELVYQGTLDGNRSIISANICSNGQYAIVSTERGYKGVVNLYRSAGDLAATWGVSSEFVSDCALMDNGNTLVILSIGQDGSSFRSTLKYHTVGTEEPFATAELFNNVVLDLKVQGDTLWALGENQVSAHTANGTLLGSYDYTNGYLKQYSLSGDGYATLLIGTYRAGSLGSLVMVSANGEVLGMENISEQVLSLSSAGRYTALLTYDQVSLYTTGFVPYGESHRTVSAQRVLMHSDGSALLLSGKSASIYLPE